MTEAFHSGKYEIVAGKNDQGDFIFSVVVKRTFEIRNGGCLQRCGVDHDLRKIDSYYDSGDPQSSTVQYEYELAPYKPAVDVVVIGKAYAPFRKPVTQMTIGIEIGDRKKSISVVGDRECRYRPNMSPTFSEPKPFSEIEVRYERAYGGRDELSVPNIPFFYPRNDMGKGIAIRNTKHNIDGLHLPNFEDPADLLNPDRIVLGDPENWPQQPLPQGLGWFQRTWYPRSTFAGSYPPYVDVETITTEERLGLVPRNHIALAKQFRFAGFRAQLNNGASHSLVLPNLKGDEVVTLTGLCPAGSLAFSLSGEIPSITLDIGSGAEQLQARLDTVSIRPDDLEVDLIWRGSCVYPGYSWLPQMKRLHAQVQ